MVFQQFKMKTLGKVPKKSPLLPKEQAMSMAQSVRYPFDSGKVCWLFLFSGLAWPDVDSGGQDPLKVNFTVGRRVLLSEVTLTVQTLTSFHLRIPGSHISYLNYYQIFYVWRAATIGSPLSISIPTKNLRTWLRKMYSLRIACNSMNKSKTSSLKIRASWVELLLTSSTEWSTNKITPPKIYSCPLYYWMFLNLILKFRKNMELEKRKTNLHQTTQFFIKGEFNTNYYLYRLNLLEEYTEQLKKERLTRP